MWRDVHRCVASTYSDLFRSLEGAGLLDPLNEVDLHCIHFICLLRLNKELIEFQGSWNHHALSSEGNKAPYQLFAEGLDHMETVHNYTVGSLDGGLNLDVSSLTNEHVTIPRISFTPCSQLQHDLLSVNPLSRDAMSLYKRTLEIVGQHLLTNCTQCSHAQ